MKGLVFAPTMASPPCSGTRWWRRWWSAAPRCAAWSRAGMWPSTRCSPAGCAALPPCPPCSQGLEQECLNTAEGCLAPGGLLGYHRELPGGMGTEFVNFHPSSALTASVFAPGLAPAATLPPPDSGTVVPTSSSRRAV